MAAEYGISPYGENIWEDKISIEGINNLSNQLYNKIYSPKEIFMLASNKDKKALNIWDNFGYNLGLALSHVVNLIDPEVISIGGGLSNAFKYFNKKMVATLKNFSPSFNHNKIELLQSKNYLNSIHQGAVLLFNEENKFIKL